MCDSMTLLCRIDRHMSPSEHKACQFPTGPLDDDEVHASGDFRTIYAISPLTVAKYSIEPVGALMPDKDDERFKSGTVVGYRVNLNIPACVIGHNRILVNGVPFAAQAALELLKFWLACNGCTREGLDRIQLDNAIIKGLTPTYFEEFDSEKEARGALLEFRQHSEAVLNYKIGKDGNAKLKPAFSIPRDPVEADSDQTYTSYIKQREFMISAYVKERNQPNSTLLPIEDDAVEAKVQDSHVRVLRLEPKVYPKLLKDMGLHKVEAWVDNPEAYKKIFNLTRNTLRLDDGLRSTRLKLTTVDGLDLSTSDKDYLRHHLSGKSVRTHADFLAVPKNKESSRYSALRQRIFKATDGIDLNIPYSVQSRDISSMLATRLVHRGEFKPEDEIAPYIFSRVSAPVVIAQLKTMIGEVLEAGSACVFSQPKNTVYRGPDRP